MSKLATFARNTVTTAASAAQMYFEPLSGLVARAARVDEMRPLGVVPLLASPSANHLWRAADRARRQLLAARLSLQSDLVEAVSTDMDIGLHELDHLRATLEIEYQVMAGRWSSHLDPDARVKASFYYQRSMSSSLKVASWLVIALEGIVAAVLGAAYLELSPATAMLVGAVTAVMVALAAAAVTEIVILGRYEAVPGHARDVLVRQVLVWGTFSLGVVAALFFTRTVPAAVSALGPLLAILAVVTPVLAGLLRTGSRLMGWSRELTRKADELTELRLRMEMMRAEAVRLREVIRRTAPSPAQPFGRPTRAITLED